MKRKYLLLVMMILSSISYSTGKINFSEQRKIEKSGKTNEENKEKVNAVVVNSESRSKIVLNDQSNRENMIRENIVSFAKKQLGKPYFYGASGNQKFDCSSFTQYVYRSIGINVPRVAAEQALIKPKLVRGIKKGDLLFFETLEKGRISHVGIYIGNRQFIHASSKSKKVTVSDFSGFYQEKFRWAVSVI